MAEHPYFTRSKDPKDFFSNRSLSKGKEKVVENDENTNLIEMIVNDPIIAERNKLIAQLFQQIDEMRAEMYKTRDLTNLPIIHSYSKQRKVSTPFSYFKSNIRTYSKQFIHRYDFKTFHHRPNHP
uniref:Uncharacterized protein n=1 Tax=Solanum tuberosum TaxID=4113 RepID=M1DTB8_SOLTU